MTREFTISTKLRLQDPAPIFPDYIDGRITYKKVKTWIELDPLTLFTAVRQGKVALVRNASFALTQTMNKKHPEKMITLGNRRLHLRKIALHATAAKNVQGKLEQDKENKRKIKKGELRVKY